LTGGGIDIIAGLPCLHEHQPFVLADTLTAMLFTVPGKMPHYQEKGSGLQSVVTDGTAAGVILSDERHRVAFIPWCARMSADLRARLAGVDLLFFDAMLWRDNETTAAGLGEGMGRRMDHMSMSGPNGTIAALSDLPIGRRVAIHINDTNPVLLDSIERVVAEAAGWTIAEDGMMFSVG